MDYQPNELLNQELGLRELFIRKMKNKWGFDVVNLSDGELAAIHHALEYRDELFPERPGPRLDWGEHALLVIAGLWAGLELSAEGSRQAQKAAKTLADIESRESVAHLRDSVREKLVNIGAKFLRSRLESA